MYSYHVRISSSLRCLEVIAGCLCKYWWWQNHKLWKPVLQTMHVKKLPKQHFHYRISSQ